MSNMKWACEQHFQKRIKYERRNFNSMQRNRNTQKNENWRKNAKRRQILIQLNDYAHCNTVQTYFKCGNSRRYCSLSFHLIHSRVVFNSHHSHKKDRCTYSRCTWIKSSNFVSNTQICHIFPLIRSLPPCNRSHSLSFRILQCVYLFSTLWSR